MTLTLFSGTELNLTRTVGTEMENKARCAVQKERFHCFSALDFDKLKKNIQISMVFVWIVQIRVLVTEVQAKNYTHQHFAPLSCLT